MILFLFSNLFHWDSCWLLIGSTEKVGSLTWLRLEIIPRNRFPYIEAPSHSPGKSYLITVACLYLYVLCNAIHEYFQIFTSILLSETEQFSFLPSLLTSLSNVAISTACLWAWWHLTLCNPMGCSPPGSSVHGILQARIPEWVTMPFSRGPSWPGIEPASLTSLAGRFFTASASWEAPLSVLLWPYYL